MPEKLLRGKREIFPAFVYSVEFLTNEIHLIPDFLKYLKQVEGAEGVQKIVDVFREGHTTISWHMHKMDDTIFSDFSLWRTEQGDNTSTRLPQCSRSLRDGSTTP